MENYSKFNHAKCFSAHSRKASHYDYNRAVVLIREACKDTPTWHVLGETFLNYDHVAHKIVRISRVFHILIIFI